MSGTPGSRPSGLGGRGRQSHRRLRVLFLAQTLPFPPDGGVKIRSYNVLRLLACDFDVTALCFYRWKADLHEQNVPRALRALSAFAHVEAFPIPQDHSRLRLLRDHAESVLTRRVYTVPAYDSRTYRRRLEDVLTGQSFDLVHVDSLDLSGYLPALTGQRVVCTHHDAQSALLKRRADAQASRLAAAYLRYQSELMRREEATWCPRVTANVAVSPVDATTLGSIAPQARFEVVPNGVDTDYFAPRKGPESGIVFVGGTSWFPNRDALEYFGEQILPILRRDVGSVSVRWVGRSTNEEQNRFRARFDVELTGYVQDVRPLVWDAACYVVPLRVGGGTRIKILDAWAMGKAVVSTPIGCEGLEARDGVNILIRDDPGSFAEAVGRVLRDAELRRSLGVAARKTAEVSYSWDVIGRKQRGLYEELAVSAPLL